MGILLGFSNCYARTEQEYVFFARDELMWVAGHGEWEKLIQGQINEGELSKLEYCKWQE